MRLPAPPKSDALSVARHWHEQATRCAALSLEAARRCGRVLVKQKHACERKRGGSTFSEWLKGLPFSRSQALRYMTLADHWELVPRDTSSLREAGEFIASYKRELKVVQRAEGVSPIADSVIHGDFRTVDLQGVDLVLTDPPYADVELYRDLGKWAERVLRPGGLLVAYSGQFHLPAVLTALGESLQYLWCFHIGHARDNRLIPSRNVFNAWKPAVMFGKPPVSMSVVYTQLPCFPRFPACNLRKAIGRV